MATVTPGTLRSACSTEVVFCWRNCCWGMTLTTCGWSWTVPGRRPMPVPDCSVLPVDGVKAAVGFSAAGAGVACGAAIGVGEETG